MLFHKLCENPVEIIWEQGVLFHMVFHTVEEHENNVK